MRGLVRDHLTSVGARGPFGQLVQRALDEPDLRRRLVEETNDVLKENKIVLPEGLGVEILENTESVVHLVLPPLVEPHE